MQNSFVVSYILLSCHCAILLIYTVAASSTRLCNWRAWHSRTVANLRSVVRQFKDRGKFEVSGKAEGGQDLFTFSSSEIAKAEGGQDLFTFSSSEIATLNKPGHYITFFCWGEKAAYQKLPDGCQRAGRYILRSQAKRVVSQKRVDKSSAAISVCEKGRQPPHFKTLWSGKEWEHQLHLLYRSFVRR